MPDRLVYSTDGGRVSNCPRCGLPYKQCRCDQPSTGSGSGSGSGGQPAKKEELETGKIGYLMVAILTLSWFFARLQ
ncbi:MAG: hypothetical protein ACJ797_05100 [Ktedonobacteraceae bacterium]